jgi:hypothetical protein
MEPVHFETTCAICLCISELKKIHTDHDALVETFFVTKRDKFQDRITRTRENTSTPIHAQNIMLELALMSIKEAPTKRDISWTSKCKFSGKKMRFNLMMIGSPDVDRFQEYLLRTQITTDELCKCGVSH